MVGYDAAGGRSIREEKQEHQRYPKSDWQQEVASGDTILGYWEWVEHRIDAEDDENDDAIKPCPKKFWEGRSGGAFKAEGREIGRINFAQHIKEEERTTAVGEEILTADFSQVESRVLSYYWTCCGGVPLTNEQKCPVCNEKYED